MTQHVLDEMPVVVTGSSRGLGRAFALALAQAGASVVVNGTTESAVRETVGLIEEGGGRATGFVGSVSDDAEARALVAHCVSTFGGIGMLVNNAGFTRDRSFTRMSVEEFDDVVGVHLRGTWSTSSAAAQEMRSAGGGRILNVTSGAGLFGMFGQANYSAAKAGVVGMTRVMDLELNRFGIRVNALAPVAATEMTAVFSGGDVGHAVTFPPPETVAPVAVYLASPEADFVHGQVLSFDGTVLSVWTHPQAAATWQRDGGWTAVGMAQVLTEGDLEFPHPDRWGAGVLPS
ncbi:MAG: SDR family NAD(P)-dependent oxidoreductase [Nocardioides sp.]|jgi:NAD(P)-dependent dehydrogenase (short-subunit alcohol dehydrogenase family)